MDGLFDLRFDALETGALVQFEVDPPNGSMGTFFNVGSGSPSVFIGSVNQEGGFAVSISSGSTGLYVFRALITDLAGNTAYAGGDAGISMLYIPDGSNSPYVTDYSGQSPVYFKPPSSVGLSSSRGRWLDSVDRQFDLGESGLDHELLPLGSSRGTVEQRAVELGSALSSYLELQVGHAVETVSGGAAWSRTSTDAVPILANALTDYMSMSIAVRVEVRVEGFANAGLKPRDQRENLLAPSNGSN